MTLLKKNWSSLLYEIKRKILLKIATMNNYEPGDVKFLNTALPKTILKNIILKYGQQEYSFGWFYSFKKQYEI